MSLTATDKGGQDFDPVPAGMQHAVCYAVIDIGTQPQRNPLFAELKKTIFMWEFPHVRIKIRKDWDGKGPTEREVVRTIGREFSLSLSQKSLLRPFLESWRGRAFTEEELKGFNVSKVAGVNCILNIIHETKNNKTFANIATVVPLMGNMVKVKPENQILIFDLDAFLASNEESLPAAIPKWIQAKILQSREYEKAYGQGAGTEAGGEAPESANPDDQDVPF